MTKRGTFSRRLCLLVFALLLVFLVGAVPVFAEGAAEEGATSVSAPSAQQVAEGLEAAEREEAARQRELETPEATRRREASATAYVGLSQAESRQLLFEIFPEELATLEADPARSLDELHLVHVLSESVATVRDAEGEGSLLEASIPLRVENDEGQLEKVKLDLTEGKDGFEAENPITELSIPPTADEPISVGEEGLAVSAPQADPSQGQSLYGTDVYFPEVATDTDMMVSPIGAGVEIFDQLRSVESPEALHFHLDLPAGATLSASASGGAEVLLEGKPIAIVPPPSAVDAQGTNVPVAVEVEDDTLTLRVRHQEGEYAMPILVDPTVAPIKENYEGTWSSGSNLEALETPGVWTPSGNDESQTYIKRGTHCLNSSLCPGSGRGLFISSMNKNIPANTYTQWVYTVPGSTTFIPSIYPEPSAVFNPFSRTNNACSYSSYPQPHDYDGAFDASGNWTWLSTNRAQWYGNDTLFTKAKGLAFGLSSGASSVNIPCWRDIMVGGVMVRLDDPESPTLNSVTGFPTGWIGEGTKFTITANLSDPGLGVQNAQVYPAGGAEVPYVSRASQCPGTRTHPCPASLAAPISLAAGNFDEGEKNVQVSGWDPTGKVSGTYTTTMRVDRQAPQISLSGQLMTAIAETEGELSFPAYNLQIKAEDGSLANAESKRSGVKSIEVFLGKQTTPLQTWTQECPGSSCSMEKTFQLKLTELEPGENTLRVVAKDQLNQLREREIKFEYVPAMGMKEEYVLQHFPLPDGKAHTGEGSSEAPELAVNVMNGNLVYRESAVDVEGPNVDLKVDPVYNSQLPTAQNTEWGDGWSLAQTPHFKRLTSTKGRVADGSGKREGTVVLPPETGETRFTSALKSTTTKQASNAYTLTDESGETGDSVIFDSSGRTDELQTPGPAKVNYSYEAGALSEIAVEDPTISSDPRARLEAIEGAPQVAPTLESSFGTTGSGNGQLSHPADVAVDPEGNLWVVDRSNNRIEKFNANGEFVSKFGTSGSGNGQLSQAAGITVDGSGNLWVVDGGNHRVQKFKPNGEYLGQFALPEGGIIAAPTGIALDAKGNAWVAQRFQGRVREFNAAGEFVKLLAANGSGEGQIGEGADVAIGPGGRIWVADYSNNRVEAFSEEGQFIRQFGTAGSGNGQLKGPLAINVDSQGNVWVLDKENSRIEQFTEGGKFLAKFGTAGSGEGQLTLSGPAGLTTDSEGHLWVTDTDNNRVQRWGAFSYARLEETVLPPEEPNDPALEVNVSSGLVSSVEGEEAGTTTFSYSGDDRVSSTGPEGEAQFTYDTAGRMTGVKLPNGTVGAITYESTNRVTALTVDPAGSEPAKTTYFYYSSEPRQTTVTPEGGTPITYAFNEDGSVFKWWNVANAPEISLAGTIWVNAEKELATGTNNLEVQADSPEGIASIEVIAGDTVVEEKLCKQNYETEEIECQHETAEWVTETGALAPGIMQVEVVAKDRSGGAMHKRFWVNVPYTPPPSAEEPAKPTFFRIKQFREEFGLDGDLDPATQQQQINNRIYDLLAAWSNPQTPEGEVARLSAEQWGVPLRPVDVAEMEYREWYVEQDGPLIDEWGESVHPTTYAGYWVDHRDGGIIKVGFTENQAATVQQMKELLPLVAADRIEGYAGTPKASQAETRNLSEAIVEATFSNPELESLIKEVGTDEGSSLVQVGATNVTRVDEILKGMYGAQAPISVSYQPDEFEFTADRSHATGQVRAGEWILNEELRACSAGFGAKEGHTDESGNLRYRKFLLTAGHCFQLGEEVFRSDQNPEVATSGTELGFVARTGLPLNKKQHYETDGEALKLDNPKLLPRRIIGDGTLMPVNGAERWVHGQVLCLSGAKTNEVICRKGLGIRAVVGVTPGRMWGIKFPDVIVDGDSGGPVWNRYTRRDTALISGHRHGYAYMAPLIRPRDVPKSENEKVPGILAAPGMGDLSLITAGE